MAYRTPPLLPPTAIVLQIVLIVAYNIVNTINPEKEPKSATEQSELVLKIKSESALRAAQRASLKAEPRETRTLQPAAARESQVQARDPSGEKETTSTEALTLTPSALTARTVQTLTPSSTTTSDDQASEETGTDNGQETDTTSSGGE